MEKFRKLAPLIGVPVMLMIGLWVVIHKNKNEKQYLRELNLKLSGVITYIGRENGFSGFGVIGLNILSSNIDLLEPKKHQPLYSIIRNGKAELYQTGAYSCTVGDTVWVDTHKQLFVIAKSNANKDSISIALTKDDRFWKYVRKHYQKF